MGALLSSLSVLRNDARSFIIVAVSETAVGVVSWVAQLISSSVAPTESATRPLQVSPLRELDGSDVRTRLQTWRERLRTAQAEEYPAENLYMGEHWSVVRDIPRDAIDRGWKVRLWICSAGYGLIQPSTRIKSYQATFSPGTKDYVARGPTGHGPHKVGGLVSAPTPFHVKQTLSAFPRWRLPRPFRGRR